MDQVVLFRIDEVCRMLGIGRSQAYALCAEGKLPTVRIGRSVRVPAEALRKWVQSQTRQPAGGDDETA